MTVRSWHADSDVTLACIAVKQCLIPASITMNSVAPAAFARAVSAHERRLKIEAGDGSDALPVPRVRSAGSFVAWAARRPVASASI